MKGGWRAVALIMLMTMSGCGTEPHSSRVVTGVAAGGAAMANVPIMLMDSSQRVKVLTTTSGAEGSYSLKVETLTPPYILKAVCGGGNYYSLATTAGTANISPYTTMIFSVASGGVDMDIFCNSYTSGELRSAAGKLDVALHAIRTKLQPLLSAFDNSDKNPITDIFFADHTGLDAMYDAIRVDSSDWRAIAIRNRSTNEIFYAGAVNDFTGGVFDRSRMPKPAAHSSLPAK
jgi:hypothetical protein